VSDLPTIKLSPAHGQPDPRGCCLSAPPEPPALAEPPARKFTSGRRWS
jgi:hypothetical protein